MQYKTKHFRLEELVSRALFTSYSSRPHLLWGLLDDRMLITIDRMRERFGQCLINTWLWGGNFQYSCFREPAYTVGAILSQHRYGRGVDQKFTKVTAPEVQADILKNPNDPAYEFVTCVERNTPTWTHIDCRTHHSSDKILWVNG